MGQKHPNIPGHRSRSLAGFLLLMAGGVLGNVFALSLFPGVDLLFGSIFVLLAVCRYGVLPGVSVAALSGIYTVFHWGHGFGILIFLLEALLVGLVFHRKSRNLVVVDGLFWLGVGMPLLAMFHAVFLRVDLISTVLIMLNLGVNGIFNALLAHVVLLVPVWVRPGQLRDRQRTVSLYENAFVLVMALIFLPALIVILLNSRRELEHVEQEASRQLRAVGNNVGSHLDFWYERHQRAINQLARELETREPDATGFEEMVARILRLAFPDFHAVFVTDATGKAIVFSPETSGQGELLLHQNFADRPYFKKSAAELKPWISDVFMGRFGLTNIQAITAPIVVEGHFQGIAVGAINLNHVRDILLSFSAGWDSEILLLDRDRKVIASTISSAKQMEVPLVPRERPLVTSESGLFLWPPEDQPLRMMHWNRSFYAMEQALTGVYPGILVVRTPVAPLQMGLYRVYIANFALALGFGFVSVLLARYLARNVSETLARLASTTTDLPAKIAHFDEITWPESRTAEIAFLISNFQDMAQALKKTFSKLSREVAERQKVENEIRLLNQELECRVQERTKSLQEMTDQLESFSYSVAHDLRAPLRAMQGFAQAVVEDHANQISETAQDYLRRVCGAAEKMDQLIQDLLAYTRVAHHQNPPACLQLDDLIAELLQQIKPEVDSRGAEVQVESPLPPVLGHRQTLYIILQNLISNSLKFAHKDIPPQIRIHAEILNDAVRLWVEDNGIGIPQEHCERIFLVFERLDQNYPGTGIGLALVKKGVTRMGGQVGVESEPGRGARFWITLAKARQLDVAAKLKNYQNSSDLSER